MTSSLRFKSVAALFECGFSRWMRGIWSRRALFASGREPFLAFALILAFAMVFAVSGCVTYIPVDEYSIARSAYDAAKDADAPRYAPALWFNAEQAYRDAQKAYADKSYAEARSLFRSTKDFSERAENAARLARHQSGDVVP